MKAIELNCQNFRKLKVIGSQIHNGDDFIIKSNAKNSKINLLIFLDSRGVGSDFDRSLAKKVINQIAENGLSYLLICRPLNLTTWATLLNFININELNPAMIITNMGFVDFTPKKAAILKDAIEQVEFSIGKGVVTTGFAEHYMSFSGEVIDLYFMNYSDKYREAIESVTNKIPTVIINTPNVPKDICVERARPDSFYIGLSKTNEFNRSINHAKTLEVPDFDKSLTYDAVHWTEQGNEIIFEKIKGYL